MASYRFDVTCPRDGTPLRHVAAGNTEGRQTRTLTQCPTCNVTYLIAVVSPPPPPTPPKPPSNTPTGNAPTSHNANPAPYHTNERSQHD